MNLHSRYGDYLNKYKKSDEINYFERRVMLNTWEDELYYTYIELPGYRRDAVAAIEEILIDCLVPPINLEFTTAYIQEQVRLYGRR